MRSRVRFPVLTWRFFLERKVSHGDHDLGSLVELRFKAPSGASYSYITIHLLGKIKLCLMGVPTSEVGHTSATTGRGDHEVHKGHVVALGGGGKLHVLLNSDMETVYLHKSKHICKTN
jgi:hypothetical protein